MKRAYESPRLYVEEFAANQAVSVCEVNSNFKYTFDCMMGPNTDTSKCVNSTIASGCSTQVGWASGYNKAMDKSSSGSHSNNNKSVASWGKSDGYLTVTYSGSVDGLLYTDSDSYGTKYWSTESGYVTHDSKSGGQHHQVAPVYNVKSVKASW